MKIYNLFFFIIVLFVMSCEEPTISTHNFTDQQILAKNLDGSWGMASNIQTGDGVSTEILENLVITFTVDDDGNPDSFLAEGANNVFNDQLGKWNWLDANTLTKIVLTGNRPVSAFNILDFNNNNILTISFVVNTVGGGRLKGIGNYRVTLQRL